MFGVGGGVVMVPAMVLWLRMDMKVAVGTSLAVIIPTALAGVIKHQRLGNIHWPSVAALASLAVVGGYVGAWITGHVSSETLKRGFGVVIILAGLRMLFGK